MEILSNIFWGLTLLFGGFIVQITNFQGNWTSATRTSVFSLSLTQTGNTISGTHCSVQQSGNRIDCSDDSLDISIRGTVNDSVSVTFKSYATGSTGRAIIRKINDTTIEWTVTEMPKRVYYIPSHAVLTKE